MRFISPFSVFLSKEIDFSFIYWLVSGYLLFTATGVMILIFLRVYLRYHDPDNFHLNIFGKKVVHSGFMSNKEMAAFIVTIPLFLLAGPYFVGRLIKLILNGHL